MAIIPSFFWLLHLLLQSSKKKCPKSSTGHFSYHAPRTFWTRKVYCLIALSSSSLSLSLRQIRVCNDEILAIARRQTVCSGLDGNNYSSGKDNSNVWWTPRHHASIMTEGCTQRTFLDTYFGPLWKRTSINMDFNFILKHENYMFTKC